MVFNFHENVQENVHSFREHFCDNANSFSFKTYYKNRNIFVVSNIFTGISRIINFFLKFLTLYVELKFGGNFFNIGSNVNSTFWTNLVEIKRFENLVSLENFHQLLLFADFFD